MRKFVLLVLVVVFGGVFLMEYKGREYNQARRTKRAGKCWGCFIDIQREWNKKTAREKPSDPPSLTEAQITVFINYNYIHNI